MIRSFIQTVGASLRHKSFEGWVTQNIILGSPINHFDICSKVKRFNGLVACNSQELAQEVLTA